MEPVVSLENCENFKEPSSLKLSVLSASGE